MGVVNADIGYGGHRFSEDFLSRLNSETITLVWIVHVLAVYYRGHTVWVCPAGCFCTSDYVFLFGCLFVYAVNVPSYPPSPPPFSSFLFIFQDYYDTYDEALSQVHAGRAWGIYQFNSTFTYDLFQRFLGDIPLPEKARYAQDGQIRLFLDYSNQQIAFSIQQCTASAYEEFLFRHRLSSTAPIIDQPLLHLRR